MVLRRDKMTQGGGSKTTLLYDFSTGETVEVGDTHFFSNADDRIGLHVIRPEASTPKNTLVFRIPAYRLHRYSEYTKGDLAKIASTIDPEDNPVLMIAKFR